MPSLFCCQEKPASCPAVKCPQPPHPAERTLHVSFCTFFVAGTGRTVSLATPIFDFSRFIENLETAMEFNNGNERRKLNAKWESLRVQYRKAGMSEEAIQAMYEFDLSVLNSERAYVTNTVVVGDSDNDDDAKKAADFKQYEAAITVTDTYHETNTRFAWVGEIKNEQLHSALEKLSEDDLMLVSLYVYEGFDTVEISKVFGTTKQNISKKIKEEMRCA